MDMESTLPLIFERKYLSLSSGRAGVPGYFETGSPRCDLLDPHAASGNSPYSPPALTKGSVTPQVARTVVLDPLSPGCTTYSQGIEPVGKPERQQWAVPRGISGDHPVYMWWRLTSLMPEQDNRPWRG